MREADNPRPTQSAIAMAASMKNVRCVGTENPAINA